MNSMNVSLGAALAPGSDHFVQFYEQVGSLADAVGDFLGEGNEGGAAALVFAADGRRKPIIDRLRRRGVNLTTAEREGRFLALDAHETLSQIMVKGQPDEKKFKELIGPILHRASDGGTREVRIFGELVAILWMDGNRDGAIRIEKYWNELAKAHRFSLFCAYPLSAFGQETDGECLPQICAEHGRSIPGESYAEDASDPERRELVIRLQQKATELAQERMRRKELEETLRRREAELRDVLEHTQEGVLDLGVDGRIRWANRSQVDFFGPAMGECVGRRITELLTKPAVFSDVWSRLARGQVVRDGHAELRRPDGTTVPVRFSGMLRMDGGVLHMRWFLRQLEDPGPAPAPNEVLGN